MNFKKEKSLQISNIDRGFDSFTFILGDLLRGERATLGLSLMDIQRALKINVDIIIAIENCKISDYTDSVFISGYVRSYAKYLNLDPDWVLERFCEESGYKHPSSIYHEKKKTYDSRQAEQNQPNIKDTTFNKTFLVEQNTNRYFRLRSLISIFSILLIVIIFGSGGFYIINKIQKVKITEDEIIPIIVEEGVNLNTVVTQIIVGPEKRKGKASEFIPRDGPIMDIDLSTVGVFETGVNVFADKEVLNNGTSLIDKEDDIYVFASRPAWVRIYTIEGEILDEEILDISQTMKVPSNIENVFLRSGNAGSVFIKIGDMSYGPVGEGTAVVKDISLQYNSIVQSFNIVTDNNILTPLKRIKVITENTDQ